MCSCVYVWSVCAHVFVCVYVWSVCAHVFVCVYVWSVCAHVFMCVNAGAYVRLEQAQVLSLTFYLV